MKGSNTHLMMRKNRYQHLFLYFSVVPYNGLLLIMCMACTSTLLEGQSFVRTAGISFLSRVKYIWYTVLWKYNENTSCSHQKFIKGTVCQFYKTIHKSSGSWIKNLNNLKIPTLYKVRSIKMERSKLTGAWWTARVRHIYSFF